MMRRALVIAAVAALAVAKPEMYKEKEDFQYSRSSSDEGSKSGFYGAQRGNMGGNYERAHNMDTLAQHQMGGLVRTVDGELGEGAKQKSGSVFTAANSRGVYGSGRYDLSNLEGRNFQEGTSFGDTQSSSLTSQQSGIGGQSYSSAANSAYGSQSQSQNSRYRGYNTGSDQALYSNNMQSADNLQSASQYDRTQLSQASGYHSQSGYQDQSVYDKTAASQQSSNAFGSSNTRRSHYRLVGASPVRVYVRPGSTVTIPVAAQSYDVSQGSSSLLDQNSQISSLASNQNSINSETEVLGTNRQSDYKPTNGAKHYESSYSYRKEWEKHDTVTRAPFTVPTVNPYPSNSELYEDTQAQGLNLREASALEARKVQSSSQNIGYNTKSASSRQQAAYNSRAQEYSSSSDSAAASNLASLSANSRRANNYGSSANLNSADLNSQVENFGSKPKSYQSSYSYHKSWERQGDPYIITPSSNGLYTAADSQASQRLTSSSLNQASGLDSRGYDSRYYQGQQADCDENGHIRVARSYNLGHGQPSYQQSQSIYEGQQSQNLENLGQQSQNLEDIGQQSQKLDNFGEQSQNLEDLGQQSQRLEDLGQQSQNLQDFGQASQTLEDFGQQTQNVGQLSQGFDRLEDLGQQTQNQWDQQSQTDAGQQTQNAWSMLETMQNSHGDRNIETQTYGVEHTGFSNQATQGSVFEINHPSLNQPNFQTTQENKLNPFTHQHHSEQGRFPQLHFGQQPGYQTQYSWQSFPSMNQNKQNADVPIQPFNVQGWQAHNRYTGHGHQHLNQYQTSYGANTGTYQTSYNYNSRIPSSGYSDTGYYAMPVVLPSSYGHRPNAEHPGNKNTELSSNGWMFQPTTIYNPNTNFQSIENGNAFTNTQTYNTRNNQSTFSTTDANIFQESDSTSLKNLWDLIDNIEKQTTSEKVAENSFHTYQETTDDVQNNANLSVAQSYNETSSINKDKIQHSIAPLSSTTETNFKTTTIKQDNLRPNNAERGDIEPEKLKPQEEAGRGDIGPEDNTPLEILGISPTTPTLTPKEIETLSLTKEKNQTKLVNSQSTDVEKQINLEQENKQNESELEVLSLDDQNKLEYSEQDNWKLQSEVQRTTSTTPKTNYPDGFGQQGENSKENINTELQIAQQNINLDRQNVAQNVSTIEKAPVEIQHNTDQQIETMGQETYNLNQQSINQFENMGQQTEDLGQEHQKTDNFGQQSGGFQQESLGNFGQQSEGFQQESLDNFGKQSETFQQESLDNFGQQNENLGQQSEGFQQESLGNFGQQNENLGQQSEGFQQESLGNFGQQNENLGQQSETFQQESLGNFGQQNENLGQQSEGFQQESLGNFGQQNENLGQQSEGFQQGSLGNFGQQSDKFGQQSEGFMQETLVKESENPGQRSDGFQQESLGNFGQQSEGFQQESLGNFGQQSENFGQQSEGIQQESLGKFGQQSENLGQQSEAFQQESLGNFGQEIENQGQQSDSFQQESLSNFGQQNENLGQQSEGFQQERLGHFGQQSENLGQETQQIESFGQQNESFQQESLGDFGKHDQMQQESLSNFELQSENINQPHAKEGKAPSQKELEAVTQKTNNVDSAPEAVTEKVGFWNKVGSKITNAKDKVKSWFSRR